MLAVIPWPLLVPIAAALAVAGLMTRILIVPSTRIAERLGAIDEPGKRHQHLQPTPRMGGIALAIGILVWVCSALIVASDLSTPVLALQQFFALLLAT